MKLGIGNYLSIIAAVGMILPLNTTDASELSNARAAQARIITDISLSPEGDLLGAVVKQDGRPIQKQLVQVITRQKVIASAKTDSKGRYRIRGLRNGIHQIKIAGTEHACRIWTTKTAPPTAKRGLITTNNSTVVRGQSDEYVLGGADLLGLAVIGGATAVTLVTTLGASDGDIDDLSSGAGSGGSGSGGGSNPASP